MSGISTFCLEIPLRYFLAELWHLYSWLIVASHSFLGLKFEQQKSASKITIHKWPNNRVWSRWGGAEVLGNKTICVAFIQRMLQQQSSFSLQSWPDPTHTHPWMSRFTMVLGAYGGFRIGKRLYMCHIGDHKLTMLCRNQILLPPFGMVLMINQRLFLTH